MESRASYDITPAGNIYFFTTRYGVEYSIEILDHSDWYGLPRPKYEGIKLMHFALWRLTDNPPAPIDLRIKATIVAFILEYMNHHPDYIPFYTIMDSDGKMRQRTNTFDRWFISSKNHQEFVRKTSQQLENQEIHFLYRTDRQNVLRFINEVKTYSVLPNRLSRT